MLETAPRSLPWGAMLLQPGGPRHTHSQQASTPTTSSSTMASINTPMATSTTTTTTTTTIPPPPSTACPVPSSDNMALSTLNKTAIELHSPTACPITAPTSQFLRLPAEIRLEIYRWLLLACEDDAQEQRRNGPGKMFASTPLTWVAYRGGRSAMTEQQQQEHLGIGRHHDEETPLQFTHVVVGSKRGSDNDEDGEEDSDVDINMDLQTAVAIAKRQQERKRARKAYGVRAGQTAGLGKREEGLFVAHHHLHQHQQQRKSHHHRLDNKVPLLSAFRPHHRPLPTALLQTCRQVYSEARNVPFCHNEFVFARSYASSLATAYEYLVLGSRCCDDSDDNDDADPDTHTPSMPLALRRYIPLPRLRLQPWQRRSIRFVRLELNAAPHELGWPSLEEDDEKKEKEKELLDTYRWTELCGGLQHGLQGLRLTLAVVDREKPGPHPEPDVARREQLGALFWPSVVSPTEEQSGDASSSSTDSEEEPVLPAGWAVHRNRRQARRRLLPLSPLAARIAKSPVVQGLRRLNALRQLEIELLWSGNGQACREADKAKNVAWCAALQEALNHESEARLHHVRVLCVRRITDPLVADGWES